MKKEIIVEKWETLMKTLKDKEEITKSRNQNREMENNKTRTSIQDPTSKWRLQKLRTEKYLEKNFFKVKVFHS